MIPRKGGTGIAVWDCGLQFAMAVGDIVLRSYRSEMVRAQTFRALPTARRVSGPPSLAVGEKELCVMRTLRKRAVFALAGAIWLAGIGSAAALTYELRQPLSLHDAKLPRALVFATAPAAVVERTTEVAPALYIPTVTLVARKVRPPAAAPAAVPAAKPLVDISRMHCKDWQDLQMGSGKVQVCE
jgi:hypothetical protein